MKSLLKLLSVISSSLTFLLLSTTNTHAATLSVPSQYSTIQAAVTAATTGDTILVSPGTYAGATLNKGVILKASSFDQTNPRNNTTILTTAGSAVITVPTGVTGNPQIIGFKLQASGGSGILSNSPHTVEYNWFQGADDQAEYEIGSGGTIRGNVFTGAGDDCIDLDNQSKDLLIENNLCISPPDDSIEMRFQDDSLPSTITVTIIGNRFEGSGGDGFQFIDYNTDTKRRVILDRNLFLNNKKAGIGFLCCTKTSNDLTAHPMREEARITNNTFVGNANGITGGGNALVLNNIFQNTTGIALKNVTGASYLSNNLFFGNTTNTTGTTNNSPILASANLNTSYVPQAGSPAIDAGLTNYTWASLFGSVAFSIPNTEYSGTGPDLGWKETGFVGPTPTTGPSPTPLPTDVPPTPEPTIDGALVSLVVPAVSDDAEENTSTGAVNLVSTDLEFITDGSLNQILGLRFDSVAIPKGAVIKSAFVELVADEAQSETTNLTFRGEASDNAPTFSTATNNISSRPKTSASVNWSNIPSWTIGNTYKSPNLSAIVQEVVNRNGWTQGNAMSFIVNGTGHRTAVAFDGSNANAAKLVIIYDANTTITGSVTPTIPPSCTTVSSTPAITSSYSIPESGVYRVWARIKTPNLESNSLNIQMDNDTCIRTLGDTSITPNTWTWVDFTDADTSRKNDYTLTQGTHVLKIYAREQEVDLDRIILTTDTTCTPEGFGDTCGGGSTISPTENPTPTTQPTASPSNTPVPTSPLLTATPIPTTLPTNTQVPSDTINPTISITNPLNGASVKVKSNISITASATDNIGVTRVVFSVGGVTSTDTSAPYSYNWPVPGAANKTYPISATAYDAGGNSSASQITVRSVR